MKRLSPARSRSSLRLTIATACAAILSAGISASALDACDYCDQGDGGMVACDSCSSRVAGSPAGPLFKGLGAIAGGLGKFLGRDECGTACDAGCDGCDAVMMQELMMAPATETPHYYEPVMPTVPPEGYSQPNDSMPGVPYTEPVPPENQTQPNGGIFDSLNDPFRDDEARNVPRLRQVEPSSFQRSLGNAARPVPHRATVTTRHANNHVQQHSNHRAASYRTTATSNSLKRAAARPTASRAPQNVARSAVHHHHHHHHAAHQHAQQQAPLTKAPVPQTQSQPQQAQPKQIRRQSMGQRHSWVPVNSYGQTIR